MEDCTVFCLDHEDARYLINYVGKDIGFWRKKGVSQYEERARRVYGLLKEQMEEQKQG